MPAALNQDQIRNITQLGRKFSDITILMHEAIARKAGLSGTDHKYLGILMQNGAMTAGELSRLTGLTTGAITGLIDRLEKKQLARREFDKGDRRKIIIVPDMQNAMKLMGDTFTDLQTRMISLISGFSNQEMATIEQYMTSAMQIMTEVTQNLNKTHEHPDR